MTEHINDIELMDDVFTKNYNRTVALEDKQLGYALGRILELSYQEGLLSDRCVGYVDEFKRSASFISYESVIDYYYAMYVDVMTEMMRND